MSELMLKIDNVSKQYRLGQIGGTTLKEEIQRWTAKKLGKDDPTKKIGAKDYNRGDTFMALDGVSFEVKKGERVGIIGHNGAGKSTLLKLISRVTAPTGGTISMNGRVASMLEVGTGFHAELTGRENVYMNGAILGMTKKEIDAKIEDIIDFSEVRKFIDTPVKRYSSGMYVKLAFSVAAHLDSEIMIMDEVLAVGDMAFQQKCLTKMSDVSKEQGRTILYVSHNMNTIRNLCDRVIVLDHRKIVFNGGVEEGIAVYMASGSEYSLKTHYDFIERAPNGYIPNQAKIESFDILNKDVAAYNQGDRIDCKLAFMGLENIDNASIRFQLYLDGVTLLGSSFLNESFNIRKGERQEVEFSLDTSNFIPAKYVIDLVVFVKDGFGNAKAADGIKREVAFEVYPSIKGEQLYWWRNPFGIVKFDDLQLSKIKKS